MILLLAHFLLSGAAYAEDLDVAPWPSVGVYCRELQPSSKLGNQQMLAPPLSVDTFTTCDPNDPKRVTEYCIESVYCTYIPESADNFTRRDFPGQPGLNFAHLTSDDDKNRVIGDLESMGPAKLPWLPTQVVCMKVNSGEKDSQGNPIKVCPDPDQCRLKTDKLLVTKGHFRPGYMEEMIERAKAGKGKVFKKPDQWVPPIPMDEPESKIDRQKGKKTGAGT